jgi:uncharacterized protein YkwD
MGARHLAAVAVVCLLMLAGAGNASASVACPTDMVVPDGERHSVEMAVGIVCDLNAIRARNGLRPLRWDWRLWAGAQRMAADVNTRDFFAHVTPDGQSLVDRLGATGYLPDRPTWFVGENLGWGRGSLATPIAIVFGWMLSPSHRMNILDPEFEEIGLGVSAGSPSPALASGMTYVADFGTRGAPVLSSRDKVRKSSPPKSRKRWSSRSRTSRLSRPQFGHPESFMATSVRNTPNQEQLRHARAAFTPSR